jgi:DNA repair protein RadC
LQKLAGTAWLAGSMKGVLAPMPAKTSEPQDQPAEVPHYLGHRERLRDRFNGAGPDALSDYELLEMLLFSARSQGDVKPLAKTLIRIFGSFAEVVYAPETRLREVKGVGDKTITQLKLIAAAASRIARGQLKARTLLSSWNDVIDYCRTAMAFADKEHFRILFLDKRNQLIADEVQQTGTVDHTPVYPREVIKRALELSATAILLVHNNPMRYPICMLDHESSLRETVSAPGTHGHKSERAAIAQVHLRGGHAGRADRGNAAPVHGTKIARRGGGQRQCTYCRLNSVRADHEIIVSGRAIGEPDRDATIVLHQGCDRRAESASDIGDTRQKRALQLGPFNPNAGTAPQRLEIGFRQHISLLVAKLPSANNRACILHAHRETEREQHAHTVGVDQEPGSQRMPTLALDELRRETLPMKSCGRGEAGYSAADDQDRLDLCHDSLQSRRTGSTVCRGSRSLAGSGLRSWIGRNSDWDQSEIVR